MPSIACAESWVDYHIAEDTNTIGLFQGVAFSSFQAWQMLDPPAGKHGYVKVSTDGHFYFDDGTRAKFWGTNIMFELNFPSHTTADYLSSRIAMFGFNAIRLHHLDFYHEPNGIFEDVELGTSAQMKTTVHLSSAQLEKLDYFTNELSKKGIYINLNTLVTRHFTARDGVQYASQIEAGGKPYAIFDSTMITLQKNYIRDLLTHVSTYTGVSYAASTQVCMIEICNENKLWDKNPYDFIPYYRREFLDQFDTWLTTKYGSTTTAREVWNSTPALVNSSTNVWVKEEQGTATMSMTQFSSGATLVVLSTDGSDFHLQYQTTGFELVNKSSYVFRFTAKADSQSLVEVNTQQAFGSFLQAGLAEEFNLTPNFETYEVQFMAIRTSTNNKVAFFVGNKLDTIEVKDMALYRSSTSILDRKQFALETEKSYVTDMKSYIQDTLGSTAPVGTGGVHIYPQSQKEAQNFVDTHNYWNYPNGTVSSFTMGNSGQSTLTHASKGWLGTAQVIANIAKSSTSEIVPKPFSITEWNDCYPAPYAYESSTSAAVWGNDNGWDALFHFAFAHHLTDIENYNDVDSWFNINSNAQKLITLSFGSRIFLGDGSGIPNIPIRRIKNTGSNFDNLPTPVWGTAPSLMEVPDTPRRPHGISGSGTIKGGVIR